MPESRVKPKNVVKKLSYPKRKKRRRIVQKLYYPKNFRHKKTAIKILKLLSEREMLSTKEITRYLVSRHSYSHVRVRIIMTYLRDLDYCEQYGLVTNKKHVCSFCETPTKFLVKSDELESAMQRIENDRKAILQYQNEEWFDQSISLVAESGSVLGQQINIKCNGCKNSVLIAPHFNDSYKVEQDKYWNLSDNGILVLLNLLKPDEQLKFIDKHTNHKIIELASALLHGRRKDLLDILYHALQETNLLKPDLQKVANEWYKDTRDKIVKMKLNPELDTTLFEYERKHHHSIISDSMKKKFSTL